MDDGVRLLVGLLCIVTMVSMKSEMGESERYTGGWWWTGRVPTLCPHAQSSLHVPRFSL